MRALWMPWRGRRWEPIVNGRDDGSRWRIPALVTMPLLGAAAGGRRASPAGPGEPPLPAPYSRCDASGAPAARVRSRTGCGTMLRPFMTCD